ncbi:CheR family methyltransferase [uncultured Friedmanniella sp.]|uniref:CheR family methyltransferase n=1 Tax=uncultured Friedmanniella sp. TaxID=335381 RepID=UPI0035CC341A
MPDLEEAAEPLEADPEGVGADAERPDGVGPDGVGPDGVGPDGVGPDGVGPDGVVGEDEAIDPAFEALLGLLKDSRSFDFTGYKRPSLMRRVRHRMSELGMTSFEAYADVLQLQPEEFTALFNTILINVTSFFRDADAWEHLRDVLLPALLQRRESSSLRVWSAGSAAGQEAYSIAMLLHEALGNRFRARVKIYATDVDEEALSHARQASYTERELAGVPLEYRERYFDTVGDRFVVVPDLRHSVIFGRNDLTRDAPISRIDLLLCRNTLMYLNAETQDRVVSRLGFALRPDGVLFLGKAEMLLNHSTVFEAVDLKRRFFRRMSSDLPDRLGLGVKRRNSPVQAPGDAAGPLEREIVLTNPVAQIAVGADGALAMVNHLAAVMLGLTDRDLGRPFQDLDVSYRPLELRVPLARVTEERTSMWLREVEWRRSGPEHLYVDVHLVPLLEAAGRVIGVTLSFFDVTRFRQLQVEVEATNRQLELAYEELQSTNEELETTNEELQSTVEELETTNEELQSANEELETMNEELQSANDELRVTNDELRVRTLQISKLNAFTQGILSSLESAVIVVDRLLVVQAWTPRSHELWGLRREETIGQYLLNLDSGLPLAELHPWLRAVVSGQEGAVTGQHVHAVNRRGRPVELRVSVSPLLEGDEVSGALVLMEDISGSAEYPATDDH